MVMKEHKKRRTLLARLPYCICKPRLHHLAASSIRRATAPVTSWFSP